MITFDNFCETEIPDMMQITRHLHSRPISFRIMPLHIKMWKSPDRRAEMTVTVQRKIQQQEIHQRRSILFTADRWYNRSVRVCDYANRFSNSNHRMVNLKKEENGIKKMTSTPVDLPQEFFRINRDIWHALTIKVGASFLIKKKNHLTFFKFPRVISRKMIFSAKIPSKCPLKRENKAQER